MDGISSRHGGHHVAQKFTKTTCPFASARVKGFPSGVLPRMGGAGTTFATGVTSKAAIAFSARRGSSTKTCQVFQAAPPATSSAIAPATT